MLLDVDKHVFQVCYDTYPQFVRSTAENFQQVFIVPFQLRIFFYQVIDLLAGMDNGRVIATTE